MKQLTKPAVLVTAVASVFFLTGCATSGLHARSRFNPNQPPVSPGVDYYYASQPKD